MSKVRADRYTNRADDGAPTFSQGVNVVGSGVSIGIGASVYSPANNQLVLGTNDSERIRIASDGNVIIGTGTLTTATTVNGNVSKNLQLKGSNNLIFSGICGNADRFVIIEALHDGRASNERFAQISLGTDSGDNGLIKFFTAAYNNGVSEAARFNSSGNLAFPSGQGIDFSATADGTGTATSELLDDYEEGTWTPTVNNMTTTGSPAYGGRYNKIGRQVTVYFFTTTANGGVATYEATGNSTNITGLPYTSGYDGPAASAGPAGVAINGNTTAGAFIQGPNNSSTTMYFSTSISSTQGISITLTYYV